MRESHSACPEGPCAAPADEPLTVGTIIVSSEELNRRSLHTADGTDF